MSIDTFKKLIKLLKERKEECSIFLKKLNRFIKITIWIIILNKNELKKYLMSEPKLWFVKLKNIFNKILYAQKSKVFILNHRINVLIAFISVLKWKKTIKLIRRSKLKNSDGSQSHHPPQEPSCWAHQDPKNIVKSSIFDIKKISFNKNFLFL